MILPTPVPSLTPAPVVTPCTTPYRDALAVNVPRAPYPQSARDLGSGYRTVTIIVTVDAAGKPIQAKVYKSGDNMAIDQVALRVALHATYEPKIEDCNPVVGSVLVHIPFMP